MRPLVRVFGRPEFAQPVRAALAAAGVEARLAVGGIEAAARPAAEPGAVEVLCLTDARDQGFLQKLKKADPRRRVLAVGPKARELALRVAMELPYGPNAWAAWPASNEDLLAGIELATQAAAVPRTRWPAFRQKRLLTVAIGAGILLWVASLIVQIGTDWGGGWFLVGNAGFGLSGVSLIVRGRYGWTPRRDLIMGGVGLACGLCGLAAGLYFRLR